MSDAVVAADDYEPLTAEKFDAATEVFKQNGNSFDPIEKPKAFEDGLGLFVKKAAASKDPAAAAAAAADKVKSTNELFVALEQVFSIESGKTPKTPLSPEILSQGLKEFYEAHKKEIDGADAETSKVAEGGRRRSKRRQPRRSAKQSKKGGRSRKNRRKQSRRRKH